MKPTAARSTVGTSWIAASGNPASARPSVSALQMTSEVRKLSEPLRRITALPDLRQSAPASAVTFGRDFIDDADHAERHAHARNLQAVRPRPRRRHLPDRIGERRDVAQAFRHRRDARSFEHQSGRGKPRRGPCRAPHRGRCSLAVDDLLRVRLDPRSHGFERARSLLGRGERKRSPPPRARGVPYRASSAQWSVSLCFGSLDLQALSR